MQAVEDRHTLRLDMTMIEGIDTTTPVVIEASTSVAATTEGTIESEIGTMMTGSETGTEIGTTIALQSHLLLRTGKLHRRQRLLRLRIVLRQYRRHLKQ